MKRLTVATLVVILLAGCGSVVTPAPAPTSATTPAPPPPTATRASTATRVIPIPSPTGTPDLAASGGAALPQLIYFWRPNCVYCTQMDPIVDTLEREYAGRLLIRRLNTYEQANVSLVQRHGISGVPATVLLGPSGDLLARWIGLTQADRLRQGLAAAGIE